MLGGEGRESGVSGKPPRHATPRHTMPRHATPHHAMPHYAMPNHATPHPHHATPRHTTPRHAMPHPPTMPHHAMPHAPPCHATPHHATPRHTMPCPTMPCHATPRHATPRYTMPRHTVPCRTTPHHAMPCHATGPVAEESWWATGLQAVESGSKTRQKHRGSLGLYKGTFGGGMGLESAVGVAGTGGEQGETVCADSAEMLARQRGVGKRCIGWRGSGETQESGLCGWPGLLREGTRHRGQLRELDL